MAVEFDVLGLGCAAVDDLLYVDAYPPLDAKAEVRDRRRQCGGLTAMALMAAARLGARAAYAGVLGDDAESTFVLQTLNDAGVHVDHVEIRRGARPIHSTIVVDRPSGSRTIFYDLEGVVGVDGPACSPDLIRRARVLLVDQLGMAGMLAAAKVAAQAGIPIVGDFESDAAAPFGELFALLDHPIVSAGFARHLTGCDDPAEAVDRLWSPRRAAVVVTCGDRGAWYRGVEHEKAEHQPAYRAQAVDSTGCGDVFHGAYAAALADARPLAERIRFASAAAALKAAAPAGEAGLADRRAVERLMAANA
jgi:sugar/nucleoside kinase (ribokinase family)